ncbi:MAG: MarR family transcriptional regulator [Polyangia bacterium]
MKQREKAAQKAAQKAVQKGAQTSTQTGAPKAAHDARADADTTGSPRELDLAYLGLFVGLRVNELVLERLHAAGFAGIRQAHGYVFQHLLVGPRSVTELAELLGVTQQAASKSVAELTALGYLQDADAYDRRIRRIALSAHGLACVRKARALRAALERRLVRRHGAEVARTRHLLAAILAELGGLRAVRTRSVRAPR